MVDFSWSCSWNGIVLTGDDYFLPCTWNMSIDFDIETDNNTYKDIAMQRLEYMIEEKYEGAIFHRFGHELADIMHPVCKSFFIGLPNDPYDNILATCTMLKMASITEDVLQIQSCTIENSLGYKIKNHIMLEDTVAIIQDIGDENAMIEIENPWFLRKDAGFTDILITDEKGVGKIINDTASWEKLGLDYSMTFADMPASETFLNEIDKERWIPFVIKGGHNDDDDE